MSTEFVSRKPSGRRISDEITASIRTDVAAGKLKVGSRLPSERALAEQFGVSRNALRESLRSLEHAGLIRLEKGATGGAIVQNRSGDAVASGLEDMYHLGLIDPKHLTEARVLYESVIIRLAIGKATQADVDALNANIDAAEAAGASGDFEARIGRHLDFHRLLTRIAGNPIMVVVMNAVLDVMLHFLNSIGPYEDMMVSPSRRRFMEHFAARDADAAVREMEALLIRLEQNYLSRAKALRPHDAA